MFFLIKLLFLILTILIFFICSLQSTWLPVFPLLFFLSLFTHFTSFLQCWLVPGGFAWRNYNLKIIRGPFGWPILGSIPLMGPLAHRKLASMATTCHAKTLMALSLGTTRVIITSEPDTAKEILSHPHFSSRPIKESALLLMFERAIGFAPLGNYWRHLRRIAMNHMFSPRRINSHAELRGRIADRMTARLEEEMEKGGFVEVRGILREGSERNMIVSVFGIDVGVERERLLVEMIREGYELIGKFNWEDHIPLRFLDFYGVKRRCHGLAAKVRSVVGGIVEERRRVGGFQSGHDFLSALLSLPEEDRLTDSDTIAVLWVRNSSRPNLNS